VCPHFHIPLQSGSDSVLKRMGRPYNTEKYYNIVEKIRAIVPYAAISADVIVGFPGETEEEHRETVRFIEKCKLANIHVFPYSRRPGTPAAEMKGQLSNKVKAERVKEIINIGKIAHNKYVEKFYGETLEILIETIDEKGNARGHTSNYLEIKIPAFLNPGNWEEGLLVDCEIQQSRLVEQ
ncbi:MAG: radical SAM protein, partial [Eubacteriales bacterium]